MITELEKTSDGHYLLKGRLSFDSVPSLWSQHKDELFDDTSNSIEIDLSRLKRSDSSGLALLIEWYRSAEQHNKTIIFVNLPLQMWDIVRVSDLDKILPFVKNRGT
jgi:phospholipid transport system transporter-binding protein